MTHQHPHEELSAECHQTHITEADVRRRFEEQEEKNQALDDILREAEKRVWTETPPKPS